jgi:hypothetical protein
MRPARSSLSIPKDALSIKETASLWPSDPILSETSKQKKTLTRSDPFNILGSHRANPREMRSSVLNPKITIRPVRGIFFAEDRRGIIQMRGIRRMKKRNRGFVKVMGISIPPSPKIPFQDQTGAGSEKKK